MNIDIVVEEKRYFYPLCGYEWGWCRKEGQCPPEGRDVKHRCPFFVSKHPYSEETYKKFVDRLKEVTV